MRIAVVGGSGFVGRHLVRRLVASGHDVVTVERRAPAEPIPGESTVLADVSDPGSTPTIASALAGTSHLVWLAAQIRHAYGVGPAAREDLALMTHAPMALLAALRPAPRVMVYASSIQVYGRPERLPVDEGHSTNPFTSYGVAKFGAEHGLRLAAERTGTRVAALRIGFIYGPGQHPGNALPRFLAALQSGRPPIIFGHGREIRDDVFVGDVAAAIELSLAQDAARGVFNVTSGRPHTLADVAETACRVAGSGLVPVHEDRPTTWIDRWFSIDKARAVLGWQPSMPFADGVRAMWETP